MKESKEKENAKRITLNQWIIHFADTATYRSGEISGWKHPKVDTKLLAGVGGIEILRNQARKLEEHVDLKGKIKIGWKAVRTDIEKIEFSMDSIPVLCKMEGVEDPRNRQMRLIKQVKGWKQEVAGISWIEPYYDALLQKLEKGNKVPEAEDSLRFQCLNAIVKQEEPIWERVFSARIFHDSKFFKNQGYRDKMLVILRQYSPYSEDMMEEDERNGDELLAMHEIYSYAQTLEWKGPLQYQIDKGVVVDTSKNTYGVVLNTQTLIHAEPFALPNCKKIMTIENKANYEDMNYKDEILYIFCHGYFTPKEVRFLKRLSEIVDDKCEFLHWGDMDYGGISIFQFIKKNVFSKLHPYKMDRDSFYQAIAMDGGIRLQESTREKLEKKDAGLLEDLKQCILESNQTIEQERLL